jgi:hypothetical protein
MGVFFRGGRARNSRPIRLTDRGLGSAFGMMNLPCNACDGAMLLCPGLQSSRGIHSSWSRRRTLRRDFYSQDQGEQFDCAVTASGAVDMMITMHYAIATPVSGQCGGTAIASNPSIAIDGRLWRVATVGAHRGTCYAIAIRNTRRRRAVGTRTRSAATDLSTAVNRNKLGLSTLHTCLTGPSCVRPPPQPD